MTCNPAMFCYIFKSQISKDNLGKLPVLCNPCGEAEDLSAFFSDRGNELANREGDEPNAVL